MGIADAKLAGYMYTISTSVLLWLTFLWGAALRAPAPLNFIREGSSGSGKF